MPTKNRTARSARSHIILVPGFGGFDALGRIEYYAGITRLFQNWLDDHPDRHVVLHYFDNLPTASVVTRANRLRKYIAKRMARREIAPGEFIVLVGHSTGGLDIRQLLWDLHHPADPAIQVDGGLPVSVPEIRSSIHGVVFLSVPHWGTNIAEWVYRHSMLRTAVTTDLQAAFEGSHLYLVDRFEAGVAEGVAGLTGAEILLALRDALAEANDDWSGDATRVSDAQEAASDLQLYFRQMATNFHVIEDLSPVSHSKQRSPAHFNDEEREEELEAWQYPRIRTLSYATVGGRAIEFGSGCSAPVFNLANPLDSVAVLRACGQSAGTDLSYRLCYRACAGGPLEFPKMAGSIGRVLGPPPPLPLKVWDNDGIVNTVSMLWPGQENVLVQADHLDIVGHYHLWPERPEPYMKGTVPPPRTYESYDTLKSTPRFEQSVFGEIWREIFLFAVQPEAFPTYAPKRKAATV